MNLATNDAVHALPIWGPEQNHVGEDMMPEREPPQGEKEGVAPAGVVRGGDVEDNRDEGTNVLHGHRLGVQIDDGSGLVIESSPD